MTTDRQATGHSTGRGRNLQWQRLAPLALIVMFLHGLVRSVKDNIYLVFGAGAGVAFLDRFNLYQAMWLAGALLLGFLLYTIVEFWRYQYAYTEEQICVRQGLVHQSQTLVLFERVQSIDVISPFYFRPFGLVVLELHTPGQAKPDVVLRGIPASVAQRIRSLIGGNTKAEADLPDFQVSPKRLFQFGFIGQTVWAVTGLVVYVGMQLVEALTERFTLDAWMASFHRAIELMPWLFPLLLFASLCVVAVGSGIYYLILHWGFRVWVRPDAIVSESGLLSTKQAQVAKERITGIVFVQTVLAKPLGIWSTRLHQASSEDQMASGSAKGAFVVPGLVDAQVMDIATQAMSSQWPVAFSSIDRRHMVMWRARIWALLLAGCFGLWAMVLSELALPAWQMLVMVVMVAGLLVGSHWLIGLRFRRWGWVVFAKHFWVRSGLLGQRLQCIPMDLVQQIQISASPYQTRHQLGNLELILPQGRVIVPSLPKALAHRLADVMAWAVESSVGDPVRR